jgi:DNA-binding transcriptional LysR family regulator
LEAGGWEVIKKYVELNLGISIVTGICLTGKEALVAIRFIKYFPKRTYGIVLHKEKLLSAAANRFIEMLKDRARRDRGLSAARSKTAPEARVH